MVTSRVLATSREPLGLPGEMISRVPPLSLPDGERGPDEAISCEAVQLFVDRAIAARAGFSLTRLNMEAVVEICRTLEGLPLAIELAAARAKSLTPQDIRARLSDRFRLLTGGRGRHQTLRSTIDWSYDLLPENERALFRRLSVFAAGFDLKAVEAICGDSLDTIEHLVDKSLVIVEQLGDDRLRYRLLETLRHYAAERLAEAGEEESARERHFTYYGTWRSARIRDALKTKRLHSHHSTRITIISDRRCNGRVHVRAICCVWPLRSVGSGICVPTIARDERGSRKRSRPRRTTARPTLRELCGP
jgi:Predicted ATPase